MPISFVNLAAVSPQSAPKFRASLKNPGRPNQLCASNPQEAFLIAFQGIRHFGGRCASAGADADAKLDRENDPYVKCHGMLTIMPQLIRSIKYLSPNLCPLGFVHMYVVDSRLMPSQVPISGLWSTLTITLSLSIRRGGNFTCHLAYRLSTKLALCS